MTFKDIPNIYKQLGINTSALGCVMLDIEPVGQKQDIELLGYPADPFYHAQNKERFWIDGWVANTTPHVTLLYGLLSSAQSHRSDIEQIMQGWSCDTVEIDHVGFFESPYADEPYYCIVAHLKITPELQDGHDRLELLPHVNTFPGYKAHITLCYLAKDVGEGVRDEAIYALNEKYKGKKLKANKELNLGRP